MEVTVNSCKMTFEISFSFNYLPRCSNVIDFMSVCSEYIFLHYPKDTILVILDSVTSINVCCPGSASGSANHTVLCIDYT